MYYEVQCITMYSSHRRTKLTSKLNLQNLKTFCGYAQPHNFILNTVNYIYKKHLILISLIINVLGMPKAKFFICTTQNVHTKMDKFQGSIASNSNCHSYDFVTTTIETLHARLVSLKRTEKRLKRILKKVLKQKQSPNKILTTRFISSLIMRTISIFARLIENSDVDSNSRNSFRSPSGGFFPGITYVPRTDINTSVVSAIALSVS
jgi:hypothetical protein